MGLTYSFLECSHKSFLKNVFLQPSFCVRVQLVERLGHLFSDRQYNTVAFRRRLLALLIIPVLFDTLVGLSINKTAYSRKKALTVLLWKCVLTSE